MLSSVVWGWKRKKEWIVWPWTLIAATPVKAKTTTFFFVVARKCLRKWDFPVPALPVRKMFLSLFSSRLMISLFSLFKSKSSGASILANFWLSRLFLVAFLKKVLKVEYSTDFVCFVVFLICLFVNFYFVYYITKRIRRGYVL